MRNELPKISPRLERSGFGETENATHPLQTNSNRIHIFLGTPKTLTIHTKQRLEVGSQFAVKDKILIVSEIMTAEKSKNYKGLFFYEVRFEIL